MDGRPNPNIQENRLSHTFSKLITILNTLDKQITTNIIQGNVKTRPASSNGIGCLALLPIILIIYTCVDNVSLLYKITTCLSVGLLFYSVLFILLLSTSCVVIKQTVFGACISSGLISTLLLYFGLKQDFTFSICVSLLSTYIYNLLLRISIVEFQKTFTIGEILIVTQALTLYSFMLAIKYLSNIPNGDEEIEFISTIISVAVLTVALIIVVLCMVPEIYKNLVTLVYIIFAGAIFALIMLHHALGPYCIINILHYVFLQQNRWKMLLFWLSLLLCAVVALMITTKTALKADTVTRKTFHVLASAVFLSGVLFDVHLMMLAAGIGFAVIVLVEALRKSDIEPISSALQSAFLVYSDEKDCGLFAMTPLYLYTGLAGPLLLVPGGRLERLAGVLSTGVGDTAASWFGSQFGAHKWTDSSKTVEGTVFNIFSQVATVYALQFFELLDAEHALLRTVFAATASGLVEAKTDQVDNLVLPLVTIIAFQLARIVSWFLSSCTYLLDKELSRSTSNGY